MEKEKKNSWIKNLCIVGLGIIIILLLFKQCDSNKELKDFQNLQVALNDTITHWKDKDGLNHSRISVLTGVGIKDFLKIESQQKDIKELQQLVSTYKRELKRGGSATIINTVTKYDTIIKIKPGDTIFKSGVCDFSDSTINDYISAHFKLVKDSLVFNLSIRDAYSIIIGSDKDGLFKKRKPFVEVTNKNPYSEVKTLRTYDVPGSKPKRFGIGPSVGVGINQLLQPSVYVGFGLNINLIRF